MGGVCCHGVRRKVSGIVSPCSRRRGDQSVDVVKTNMLYTSHQFKVMQTLHGSN